MASSHLISAVKAIIPPLLPTLHKGQAGRTMVVGGSENYTGAPFYSCMSSMLLGADMSHILCEKHAGPILKALSPDLIVFPELREGSNQDSPRAILARIQPLFDRMHSVVIGPGLGRDKTMLDTVLLLLRHLRAIRKPTVIDADGLWLLNDNLDVVFDWPEVILTPNTVEFARLWKAAEMDDSIGEDERCKALASHLKVTILQKGLTDVVSDGTKFQRVELEGGLKRCGGQGDILSGTCATFLAWLVVSKSQTQYSSADLMLAAIGASLVTRTSSRLAFKKKGRSMMSTDVLEEVGSAYRVLFDTSKL